MQSSFPNKRISSARAKSFIRGFLSTEPLSWFCHESYLWLPLEFSVAVVA